MPKYDITQEDVDRLNNNFRYHAPKEDQVERYQHSRDKFRELAQYLMENCPRSRELSLAITHIEEASMWANAAIARNE